MRNKGSWNEKQGQLEGQLEGDARAAGRRRKGSWKEMQG